MARTLVEATQQLQEQSRQLGVLLERAPQPVRDASFEYRYSEHIVDKHGMLRILGLRLRHQEGDSRPLDAVYLSLEATAPVRPRCCGGSPPPPLAAPSRPSSTSTTTRPGGPGAVALNRPPTDDRLSRPAGRSGRRGSRRGRRSRPRWPRGQPRARSRLNAALMSARWVNA
ncbi:hypothetical protein ACFV42_11625 [Streptomyces solisilvae]|uniref:hypothetical protein n=1 Tax=Streptomyces malaysiensis TaxID=92644 RepID=UPI00369A6842